MKNERSHRYLSKQATFIVEDQHIWFGKGFLKIHYFTTIQDLKWRYENKEKKELKTDGIMHYHISNFDHSQKSFKRLLESQNLLFRESLPPFPNKNMKKIRLPQ